MSKIKETIMYRKNRYILLDCNNLLWRVAYASFSARDLSIIQVKNPLIQDLIVRFMYCVLSYMKKLESRKVIFCWDKGESKRKEIYPEYKLGRSKENLRDTTKEAVQHAGRILMEKFLPDCGFNNVLYWDGYEADDLIAAYAKVLYIGEIKELVIVSTDKDLYQCVNDLVWIWNPVMQRRIDLAAFKKEYGEEILFSDCFALMKALTGCKSDNIPGIPGIGEKTAVAYVLGRLSTESRKYELIVDGWEIIVRNRKLVTLPFRGTPHHMPIVKDQLSPLRWKEAVRKHKVCKLLNLFPKKD